MNNNKGMTLIELLVAFSISAIILSSLAYFIFTAIGMYNKNGIVVDLQNEAQLTMNQIVDCVMEAEGVVLAYDKREQQTECVLLGKIYVDESGTLPVYYYAGNAMVTNLAKKEMYLASFPNPYSDDNVDYREVAGRTEGGITYARMEADDINTLVAEVISYANNNHEICLMAQHVTKCYIREIEKIATEIQPFPGEFSLPFAMQIDLLFEQDYGNGVATRECSDKAVVRSQIDYIYVNGTKYNRELKK